MESFDSRFASMKRYFSLFQTNTSKHPLVLPPLARQMRSYSSRASEGRSQKSGGKERRNFLRNVSIQTPSHPALYNLPRIANSANTGFPSSSKTAFPP